MAGYARRTGATWRMPSSSPANRFMSPRSHNRSCATWDETATLSPNTDLYAELQSLPHDDYQIRGDASASAKAWSVESSYRRPYQMHAAIGPSCAVALYDGGKLTVWTHSQGVYPL